jgi:hypothetical protein
MTRLRLFRILDIAVDNRQRQKQNDDPAQTTTAALHRLSHHVDNEIFQLTMIFVTAAVGVETKSKKYAT